MLAIYYLNRLVGVCRENLIQKINPRDLLDEIDREESPVAHLGFNEAVITKNIDTEVQIAYQYYTESNWRYVTFQVVETKDYSPW